VSEQSDEYDCERCGACCFAPFPGDPWVDVRPEDPTPRALTQVYTSEYDARYAQRGMAQTDGGRCVALRILSPGPDDPRVCTCGIYPERPQTCRAFTAGSVACLALRKKRLLDPLKEHQKRQFGL
jgi:Fe-S-cluster containining protein